MSAILFRLQCIKHFLDVIIRPNSWTFTFRKSYHLQSHHLQSHSVDLLVAGAFTSSVSFQY